MWDEILMTPGKSRKRMHTDSVEREVGNFVQQVKILMTWVCINIYSDENKFKMIEIIKTNVKKIKQSLSQL